MPRRLEPPPVARPGAVGARRTAGLSAAAS